MEDERLRIEAAQKDPRRFADLYEENFERVYAFVVRRVGDRNHAQDLTSEIFEHALANLQRFEWRGVPFAAWLYRIAANTVADHYQRVARERRGEAPPPVLTTQDDLDQIERRATLFRLVDRLPADQRRVIVLRFAEEMSIREVAEEFGRSEGAIKQLQSRALQTLRAQLDQDNG